MALGLVPWMDDFFEIAIFVSNGHGPLRARDWAVAGMVVVVVFTFFILLGDSSGLVIRPSIRYSICRQPDATRRRR